MLTRPTTDRRLQEINFFAFGVFPACTAIKIKNKNKNPRNSAPVVCQPLKSRLARAKACFLCNTMHRDIRFGRLLDRCDSCWCHNLVGEGRSQCLFRLLPWKLHQQQGSGRIFDKIHRYILPSFGIVHRSVIILGCACVFVVRLGVTWSACNSVCVCVCVHVCVVVVSFVVMMFLLLLWSCLYMSISLFQVYCFRFSVVSVVVHNSSVAAAVGCCFCSLNFRKISFFRSLTCFFFFHFSRYAKWYYAYMCTVTGRGGWNSGWMMNGL